MTKRPLLSRRTALIGSFGTTIALPFLEAMAPARARAQTTSPSRYVVCFAGTSLGTSRNMFVPGATGADYPLTMALAPIGAHGVQSDVGVVTGLRIPWQTGSEVPPGGRPVEFHSSTVGPLLSGMRANGRDAGARGPTSDQIVAQAIGGETRFRSLELRVQASTYRGGDSNKSRMSYRRDGSGRIVAVPPVISPRLAFDTLFSGGAPTSDEDAAARALRLQQRRSVLDSVGDRISRLMGRVGAADRRRLERHFDELRAIERAIDEIPTTGACEVPADPGRDAPIDVTTEEGGSREIGYAHEKERARVMCDLVRMALACDLTRSVSLMITCAQSFMNVVALPGLEGRNIDVHELGHGAGSIEEMSRAIAWHVDSFSYLTKTLRDTPDEDASLLDRTALVLLFEGGHGHDPESGEAGKSHSSENMAALFAGRVGGLRPGRHIAAAGAHPARVAVAAMNAVGVDGGLGEVSSSLDAMFEA
ncbi:DUF1552 domain-containing protein [Sandaracinus amylolyticus]|uniref:Tat (Twin-arginine translocation) pathway signal sequence domain protein n=1 Tax=Sandaracinus amylolyticus TaxID=927083 RepID=A0A0F6VZ09_9BACT|nr:DUF1552 domain-containing protein [Sandaracinus amylolyticus]AKF03065.1 hypothetical protein DB32_000214 [Sandaracinus amylolyticus]